MKIWPRGSTISAPAVSRNRVRACASFLLHRATCSRPSSKTQALLEPIESASRRPRAGLVDRGAASDGHEHHDRRGRGDPRSSTFGTEARIRPVAGVVVRSPVDAAKPRVGRTIVAVRHALGGVRHRDRASVRAALRLGSRVTEWLEHAGPGRVVCQPVGSRLERFLGVRAKACPVGVEVVGRLAEGHPAGPLAVRIEDQRLVPRR